MARLRAGRVKIYNVKTPQWLREVCKKGPFRESIPVMSLSTKLFYGLKRDKKGSKKEDRRENKVVGVCQLSNCVLSLKFCVLRIGEERR